MIEALAQGSGTRTMCAAASTAVYRSGRSPSRTSC